MSADEEEGSWSDSQVDLEINYIVSVHEECEKQVAELFGESSDDEP